MLVLTRTRRKGKGGLKGRPASLSGEGGERGVRLGITSHQKKSLFSDAGHAKEKKKWRKRGVSVPQGGGRNFKLKERKNTQERREIHPHRKERKEKAFCPPRKESES